MINKKTVTAIILAAGNSTRYGKGKNKNFEILNEKPVVMYSIEAFDKNDYIDNIIIAIKECEIVQVQNIINSYPLNKNLDIIIGGNSRKESVYNCIKNIDSDIVIIQDGARPMIKQQYITSCIENMKDFEGVTIGIESKDTIKITDNNNIVIQTPNRNNTWLVQTPQCFNRTTLLKTHEKYINEDATDDCSLLEKEGYPIKIIDGNYNNIKITTSDDLNIIRKIYL